MNFANKSIKEIKAWLESCDYSPLAEELNLLRQDGRAGLKPLLERVERKQRYTEELREEWQRMTVYERDLRQAGYIHIAGVDEVGRGPLAGPVVSAAVILPQDFYLPGLNDSKKLSKEEREEYYQVILEKAIAVGVSMISPEMIDQINILNATKQAMITAIQNLPVQPDYLLIDALTLDVGLPQVGIIGGDGKSISIAAASVVAKVTRDRWMCKMSEQFPEYGFDRHMGYGTKEHLEAIAQYGVTPIHRHTFAGVKEWVEVKKVGV